MSAATPVLPLAVVADRKPILDRALQHLPDELLTALHRSLDRHDLRLNPGRLYHGPAACAMGMMLRDMFPAAHTERGLHRWWKSVTQVSVYDSHRNLAKMFPRLAHIEYVFDSTIARVNGQGVASTTQWATTVGHWIADCVAAELERRQRDNDDERLFLPQGWKREAGERRQPLALALG
jgi:hypothetical protein